MRAGGRAAKRALRPIRLGRFSKTIFLIQNARNS